MIRTCKFCGVEFETKSARSEFVCNAMPCLNKTRKMGRPKRDRKRERFYWKRLKRIRSRKVRRGQGPEIHGV